MARLMHPEPRTAASPPKRPREGGSPHPSALALPLFACCIVPTLPHAITQVQ